MGEGALSRHHESLQTVLNHCTFLTESCGGDNRPILDASPGPLPIVIAHTKIRSRSDPSSPPPSRTHEEQFVVKTSCFLSSAVMCFSRLPLHAVLGQGRRSHLARQWVRGVWVLAAARRAQTTRQHMIMPDADVV